MPTREPGRLAVGIGIALFVAYVTSGKLIEHGPALVVATVIGLLAAACLLSR